MTHSDTRPNWLSVIIEEKRSGASVPTPLVERKAQRDAIVAAIQVHPQGEGLAALAGLGDAVWAALGVAHRVEQEARQNLETGASAPSIQASLFLFGVDRNSGR
jgi:hypothetical protein